MDEQIRTRDSQRSIAADQNDQMNWSESSHTYYFSKFQLFEDHEEINQFYKYSVFLEKLSEELGEEWKAQANALYSPYFNSQDIFMNLLAIWLQAHPVINTIHHNPLAKISSPVFSNSFIEEFINRIRRIHFELSTEKKQLKINTTSTKTVCMGFFISANQIWQEMFRIEEKDTKKGFSLFKGVTKKIQSSLQTFQPLMVVTQKISNLFGRKKIKFNETQYRSSSKNDVMFGDCYMQFRKTIGLEKQLERKMSQFNLEDDTESKRLTAKQQKTKVEKNQFEFSESPIQKNVLSNLYSYVTRFLNRKYPWQVASSFVTNILDINQQSMEDGTKIKVLKPASDFYQKLIMGWLMLRKCNEQKTLNFQTYLSYIKVEFGKSWKEKYIIPSKYFFERLIKHWNDIKKQTTPFKLSQKQLMSGLIIKIRESMRQDWQRKIKMQRKMNCTQ